MRIYVADDEVIIEFDEGTGDNLLPEDIEAGYVDYVNYTVYDISDLDYVREVDGGMILLKKPYSEVYSTEFKSASGRAYTYFDDDKLAKDVLDMAGYNKNCEWRWL